MTKKITSSSTSCRAKVLAYQGESGTNAKEVSILNIMSFYYQKGINSPYGEFSLEITNTRNYYKTMSVGDWIGVYLNNGTEKESLRCLGNISRIQKRVAIANDGTKTTTWQIFGYDYGKFFQTYKIFADPQILADQIFQNTVAGNQKMLIGSSSELVRTFINKYLLDFSESSYGTLINVPEGFSEAFFPSGGTDMNAIYDFLQFDIKELSREATINLTLNALQPLWTILKTLSNSIVNELFLEMSGDTGEERPTVFLRPYPYSFKSFGGGGEYNNKFLDLPSVSVDAGDILEQGAGISDAERQNLFKIFSNVVGTTLGASVNLRAKIIKDSVERYGPCYATYTTSFADHGAADPTSLLNDWTELLEHWYANNHKLENGAISIKGNPLTRVGKRLDISGLYKNSDTSKSYYIEGYADQWSFPGIWTQTLQLNRGVVISGGNENYTSEFDGDDILESSSSFEGATR